MCTFFMMKVIHELIQYVKFYFDWLPPWHNTIITLSVRWCVCVRSGSGLPKTLNWVAAKLYIPV